jgi:uncharacterized protein
MKWIAIFPLAAALGVAVFSASAQVPPSAAELAAYKGIHLAAAEGDYGAIRAMAAAAIDIDLLDKNGRTPFLISAYRSQVKAMEALAKAGADVNMLDAQLYDAVTIAAVADDLATMKAALALGNKATNITSPYNGTALIAAAHLGHDEVVKILIEAGAPLDHVNNLGWTALIEAVVLGDGGPRHQKTLAHLLKAGADRTIADRNGVTPLELARQRGYDEMVKQLEQ